MRNIADKADATPGSTGELTAEEYNDPKNERQTAVERSGQTLNAAITDQLSKALFINAVSAQTFIDSGSANSVILAPATGANGLTVPDSYAELDGAVFFFDKAIANTSTTVTANIGQTGTELGAKNITKPDGSAVILGEVLGRCSIRWNNGDDRFEIIDSPAIRFRANSIVGSIYIQYPNKMSPAELFLDGTWTNISSEFAGDFFRAEGGDASAFESGEQTHQLQGHEHQFAANNSPGGVPTVNTGGVSASLANLETDGIVTDGTNGTPNVGTETRPVNRTIRVWERTA